MSTERRRMRLSSIARLYRARLRERTVLVQELFALLGIAVGVALLFASQVAGSSLSGSVGQLTNGVIGASKLQLVARDSHGFDAGLLEKVRRLPGVQAAVPVLEERANVVGPRASRSVDLIATDPRAVQIGGPLLRHFGGAALAGQRAIALPTPLAQALGVGPLQTVGLQVGAREDQVLVGAGLGAGQIGALADSPIAIVPLAYAQQLTGLRGRVTRIFVEPRPGGEVQARAGLLALAAGRLNVEPADSDATFFEEAAGPIDQATTLFSGISALVGFMFAYCAMLLTVPLRRSLVRDLRRDGATRWMTIKTLLFDALVLGVVATLAGLALGEVLSRTLFQSSPGYLEFAFPVGTQRIVTWQSVALAVAAGMLAACVGVLTPLRDIFARPLRDPTSARRGPVSSRRRGDPAQGEGRGGGRLGRVGRPGTLAGGLLCLAVAFAVLGAGSVSLAGALLGILGAMAAMVLLLPTLLDGAIAIFEQVQRPLMSGAARLAVIELHSPLTRTRALAIAATGAIAVFASVTIQGAVNNLQQGLNGLFSDVTSVADIWVATPGAQNLLATTPLLGSTSGPTVGGASASGDTVSGATLARLPGVRAVGAYRASFLDYGARRVWVLAPPSTAAHPIPPSQLQGGGLALATARLREGGWAALSKVLADEEHLRIGERFTLPAPNPTSFRLAALTTNLGWPPGAIVLSPGDYVRAWGSADPSAYNVMLAPGASSEAVRGEVRRALGSNSGLVVESALERDARQLAASHAGLQRLAQIAELVLFAGALAIAIAMSAMISQRRPQMARMKLEGFSRGGLWRSLLLESGLLLGTGALVGALFGILGELLQSHALLAVTGFPVVSSVGVPAALASLAFVLTVAGAFIAVRGYRAAGVRPHPAT
jgi:putative ABC transport system permease protein